MAVPIITSPLTVNIPVLVPFLYQITASNSPTGFGLVGAPNSDWKVTTSGLVSGPASLVSGSVFTFSITASNASGTATEIVVATVTGGGTVTPPTGTLPPPPPAYNSGYFNYTESNPFSEDITDPCFTAPLAPPPDAPKDLIVVVTGAMGDTSAIASWTP